MGSAIGAGVESLASVVWGPLEVLRFALSPSGAGASSAKAWASARRAVAWVSNV
ncbi:hypothetical protein [Kribbella sp. C-35]|uniref:hypothetical protein n=1 Tax=Kribbella sp. C-35 TaxID=2789276 RepID=UPI00397BE409